MSKPNWVACCAAVAAATVSAVLTAQDQDPFGGFSGEPPKSADAVAGVRAVAQTKHQTPRQAADARIEGALNQQLKSPLEFPETPLAQIMQIISQDYGIQIVLDERALDALAITPETEITVNLRDISLRSALDIMLRSPATEDLTYIVDNEVLLITSQDEADSRLEVRVYRVDDLIRHQYTGELDFDRVIDLIVASVFRDSWQENGLGQGEIQPLPPGILVVSQTRRVHQRIAELLAEIRSSKADIEADADDTAQAAELPRTRAFRIENVWGEKPERSFDVIHDVIIRSVEWEGEHQIDDEEALLAVLPDRVIVRHLPHVVAQVDRVLRELDLVKTRGSGYKSAPIGQGGRGFGRGTEKQGGGYF